MKKKKSKRQTMATLLRFPNPSLEMASTFHCGKGGLNVTVCGAFWLAITDCFKTPRGSVHRTASAEN